MSNKGKNDNLILVMIIASAVAGLAPVFIKKYDEVHEAKYMGLAGLMYVILIYSYYLLFKTETLGVTYNVLKIGSIILVTAISYIFFSEEMSQYQVAGFLLGILAIYLLGIKET